jgi:hypothetical protein
VPPEIFPEKFLPRRSFALSDPAAPPVDQEAPSDRQPDQPYARAWHTDAAVVVSVSVADAKGDRRQQYECDHHGDRYRNTGPQPERGLAAAWRRRGRKISDDAVKLAVGASREGSRQPVLELIVVQPSLGGRYLKALRDLLAIGVGCSPARLSGHVPSTPRWPLADVTSP